MVKCFNLNDRNDWLPQKPSLKKYTIVQISALTNSNIRKLSCESAYVRREQNDCI